MNDQKAGAPAISRFGYTTDEGSGARARIGLLVLQSDQTMEAEIRQMLQMQDIAIYHARLANNTTVTAETLITMQAELPVAAKLLPDYLGLNALGYGCTSGATIIGEQRVAEILQETHPNVPSSNPLSAAKAALAELGVKRLGLVTPYNPEVTGALQDAFEKDGIRITEIGSFYQGDDKIVGRISKQSILDAALSVGQSDVVDGVFISCTSLRAAGIIDQVERTLGKPVTASNHALAWHLLRLAGIKDQVDGFGRLFKVPHTNEAAT